MRLVSITQELGDDPAHVMLRQVIALFDEYQSKETAKHVLRSMKENALAKAFGMVPSRRLAIALLRSSSAGRA